MTHKRTEDRSRPSPWIPQELEERDGALIFVQPTKSYDVSNEEAKEDHLRSGDDIEADLASRMDECEV